MATPSQGYKVLTPQEAQQYFSQQFVDTTPDYLTGDYSPAYLQALGLSPSSDPFEMQSVAQQVESLLHPGYSSGVNIPQGFTGSQYYNDQLNSFIQNQQGQFGSDPSLGGKQLGWQPDGSFLIADNSSPGGILSKIGKGLAVGIGGPLIGALGSELAGLSAIEAGAGGAASTVDALAGSGALDAGGFGAGSIGGEFGVGGLGAGAAGAGAGAGAAGGAGSIVGPATGTVLPAGTVGGVTSAAAPAGFFSAPEVIGTATGAGAFLDAAGNLLPGTGQIMPAATQSILSKIISGTANADDYAKLISGLAPAALGAYASNKQANSLEDIASRYEAYGAPSRARYEGSYAPGFTMANDPGFTDALNQASTGIAHALSVNNGNPYGNPNALIEGNKQIFNTFAYPALKDYRITNANTGGLSSMNLSTGANLETNATNANANIYNAVGAGLANVFNPPKSSAETLADLLRTIQGSGVYA